MPFSTLDDRCYSSLGLKSFVQIVVLIARRDHRRGMFDKDWLGNILKHIGLCYFLLGGEIRYLSTSSSRRSPQSHRNVQIVEIVRSPPGQKE